MVGAGLGGGPGGGGLGGGGPGEGGPGGCVEPSMSDVWWGAAQRGASS